MIYGLVPVGGVGSRLNLPFHKELLPLKGYNSYYPVCKLTVDNMLFAGAEKIIFIHGSNKKKEIVELFNNKNFLHLNNNSKRQSEVFSVFFNNVPLNENDVILYGLPDSYYNINLFPKMLNNSGLVCGMYKCSSYSNVGRIDIKTNKFIKSQKNAYLSEFCWGVLKFDYNSIKNFNYYINKDINLEAEELLNFNNFSLLYGDLYYDLGTWDSINSYWNC